MKQERVLRNDAKLWQHDVANSWKTRLDSTRQDRQTGRQTCRHTCIQKTDRQTDRQTNTHLSVEVPLETLGEDVHVCALRVVDHGVVEGEVDVAHEVAQVPASGRYFGLEVEIGLEVKSVYGSCERALLRSG